ncbi:MAG: Uma2 family endonuclease [Gemmataceae bacterium]|nr:Uma2 family endonuclease [Gemmataceae bacterium]
MPATNIAFPESTETFDHDDELFEVIGGLRIAKDVPIPNLGCDDRGTLFEIIDGKREEKAMGFLASIIASSLGRSLGIYAENHQIGLVILEAIYRFSDASSRRPDISLISYEQLAAIPNLLSDPAEPEIVPKLAIEVISPTNTYTGIEIKLIKYFTAGVEAVWVVHPTIQRVYVYPSPMACKIFGIDDILDGGNVVPGFALPLRELFTIQSVTPKNDTK